MDGAHGVWPGGIQSSGSFAVRIMLPVMELLMASSPWFHVIGSKPLNGEAISPAINAANFLPLLRLLLVTSSFISTSFSVEEYNLVVEPMIR